VIPTFNSYTAKLIENRYGTVSASQGDKVADNYCKEFEFNYAAPLIDSHLKILIDKKTNFVGTKTLCSALKFIQTSLKS
jgi:hypothetical protein